MSDRMHATPAGLTPDEIEDRIRWLQETAAFHRSQGAGAEARDAEDEAMELEQALQQSAGQSTLPA